MQPGDKLPTEAEFMARFEVSRTVVREAISKLQASGLVETRHGIGTFVIEPPDTRNFKIAPEDFATVADVIALLELRISLETESAGLAAQRRTPANLVQLTLALQHFQRQSRTNPTAHRLTSSSTWKSHAPPATNTLPI